MSNKRTKTMSIFFVATALLLGAALVANPMRQVNAQGNATNGMNQTGAVGVLTIKTIDEDSLMNQLKAKYPKLAALTGAEDRDLIGTLKELKDVKEAAKTIVAANILRDLIQYKALENMQ
jgi:hypothetical protein